MKKIFTLIIGAVACMSASAQYICLEKGTTMDYSMVLYQEKDSTVTTVKATIFDVSENNGIYTVLTQEVTPLPESMFGEKTDTTTTVYNSADKSTQFILTTAAEAKQDVIDMVKMQIQASGQSVSVAEMDDFISSVKAKGELSLTVNPDMAAGTKLPNKNLRINVGQDVMSYNLWEGKVLGNESVTTPAGTFECLKVSFVNRINAGGQNQKIDVTEWLAPNIGAVKVVQSMKGKPLMKQELTKIVNAK